MRPFHHPSPRSRLLSTSPANSRYRWVALFIAFLSQWGISLCSQMIPPLAPLFQPDLGLSKAQVGVMTSSANLGTWITALPGGLAIDRFGIRWMSALALTVAGSILLLMPLAGSFLMAWAIILAAGLSRGMANPGATKAVMDWFSARSRATAMGVKQMGMPSAGFLTAFTLPAIALALGWRNAITIVGLFVISAGVATAVLYRDPPHAIGRSARFDIRTALAVLLRSKALWLVCAMSFFFLAVQFSLLSYLALYLHDIVLVSAIPDDASRIVAAGGYLAVCQIGGFSGRPFWGLLSDRLFGGRRGPVLAIISCVSALFASILALFGGPGFPLWLLTAIVFAYGVTAVGWPGVYNAMLTETVGHKYAATGVGLSILLSDGAAVIAPPSFGLVVDITGSYQTAWFYLAGLALITAGIAFVASRREGRLAIEDLHSPS